MTEPTQYSYLLRLWCDHTGAPWRATLIAVARPEEPRHFATLEELCGFLVAHSSQATLPAPAPKSEPRAWDHGHCTPDDPE